MLPRLRARLCCVLPQSRHLQLVFVTHLRTELSGTAYLSKFAAQGQSLQPPLTSTPAHCPRSLSSSTSRNCSGAGYEVSGSRKPQRGFHAAR